MTVRIITAHVLEGLAQLADESVHCVVTSPPYYGLRDYGIEPQVWGGDPNCSHTWTLENRKGTTGGPCVLAGAGAAMREARYTPDSTHAFCLHCNAWRGSLGLEPTLDLYLDHMVEVFREVRRVMRKDATCWLNIGDSYASSGSQKSWRSSDANNPRNGSHCNRDGVTGVPGFKPKDLMLIPSRLAIRLCDDGWWVRSDIAWCLSGGTRVYARTQKGDMPTTVKDLVRLDPATVKLWNGEKWTQVLGWGQVPRPEKTYEIEFRSGERVGCTAEHKWPAEGRGDVPAEYLCVGDIIQTCRLPRPEVPRVPAGLEDQDIGWLVGTFLADGSWAKDRAAFQIASNKDEDERFARLQRLAERYDGSFAITWHEGNGCDAIVHSRILAAVIETYLAGDNADGKHLGVRCWRRTDRFLDSLLLGYLQGDGHWETTARRWRIGFCQNDTLAADLRTLCARLGYQLRLRRHVHQSQWGDYPGWRGEIRFEPSDRCKNDGEIVAIRESRARKFWDISVEDEPHLFALASGVLTHNCKRAPMPESCTDRPTSAWEHVFLLTKSARYFYDQEAVKEESETNDPRRPYTSNGAKSLDGREVWHSGERRDGTDFSKRNLRNFWLLGPEPFPEAHFATFPSEIPRICIKAGTSERGVCPQCAAPWERQTEVSYSDAHRGMVGNQAKVVTDDRVMHAGRETDQRLNKNVDTIGWLPTCSCAPPEPDRISQWNYVVPATVLDPFLGAGTTALVADQLGRNCIGIELSESYARMAENRIRNDAGMFAEIAAE